MLIDGVDVDVGAVQASDARLAWSNAKLFNLEGSDLWMAADRLSREFEALFCEWVINAPDGYGCVCVRACGTMRDCACLFGVDVFR